MAQLQSPACLGPAAPAGVMSAAILTYIYCWGRFPPIAIPPAFMLPLCPNPRLLNRPWEVSR